MNGTAIEVADRAAWLAERRTGIGASEAAAALGVSPWETPLQLWMRKTGRLAEADVETEPMRWGHLLEPLIAAEYERRTGRRVERSQVFWRDEGRPHLFATLDGYTDTLHPVEFKAISAWKRGDLGDDGTDELPDHWLVQAQVQMHVSGSARCDFAVLVGGQELRLFTVAHDAPTVAAILPRLDDFWGKVVRHEPPEADVGRDGRAIALLHPDAAGEVTLGAEAATLADSLDFWRATRRQAEEGIDRDRAGLLLALGDRREGVLPDGRRVRRYDTPHPGRTQVVKAYTSTTVKVIKARS